MRLNKYEEAVKDWQSFLRYEPDVADVYNSIGVCYQYLGKYDQSLAPINKAINLKATPEFYLTRSYSYYGLNNLEKARADALKARQGGMNIPQDYALKLGIQ
jgi:tetratricopeptide (TPR) repeat protein